MNDDELKERSQAVASGIGGILQQRYKLVDGKWWLYTRGMPQRVLTPLEVQWHVDRRHKPFVEDGIEQGHPDWWKVPHVS